MPDVFALLSSDHREVEGLFQQYDASKSPDLAQKICDELTIHAMLEEELVYPVLAAKVEGARHLAEEARHEHAEAKQLIAQIEAGLRSGEDVSGVVKELEQAVAHHVQEEESEVFPAMRDKLPSVTGEMGPEVVARKEQLIAQMAEVRGQDQSAAVVGHKLL